MRKALFLVSVLLCLAFYASHKQYPSHKQEGEHKPAETVLVPGGEPHSPQQAPQSQEEVDWINRLLAWPDGVGALAVICTLGAIVWQSEETRKAADAANRGIEVTKTKERAKLLIEFGDVQLRVGWKPEVLIRVSNFGLSNATIGLAIGRAFFTDSEEVITPSDFLPLKITDSVMLPNAEEHCYTNSTDGEIYTVGKILHIHGIIVFRDAFEDSWKKHFHAVWRDYGNIHFMEHGRRIPGKWSHLVDQKDERIGMPPNTATRLLQSLLRFGAWVKALNERLERLD